MGKRNSLALRSAGPTEASVPTVPVCLGLPANWFCLLVWFFGDILPFLSPGNPTSWSKGCSSCLGRSPLALTRFILRFFRTYWLKPVWWRGIWHPLSWSEENLLLLKYFLVYSAASLGTFPSTCRSEAQFIESFFFFFFLNQKCQWGLCFWGHTTPSTSAMDSSTAQRNVLFAVVVFFLPPSRTRFMEMVNCAALLPLKEGHFLFHQPCPTMNGREQRNSLTQSLKSHFLSVSVKYSPFTDVLQVYCWFCCAITNKLHYFILGCVFIWLNTAELIKLPSWAVKIVVWW